MPPDQKAVPDAVDLVADVASEHRSVPSVAMGGDVEVALAARVVEKVRQLAQRRRASRLRTSRTQ